MKQELQLFNFEGQELRVVIINSEPHLIAKDVCAILDVVNVSQALARLDDDEKGICLNDTLGGEQELSTVNESGFYSLVLSSRKKIAKPFKRWVTHDVLPSIRKTGSYSVESSDNKQLETVNALRTSSEVFQFLLPTWEVILQDHNQACLASDKGAKKATGISILEFCETSLVSEVQEQLLTVTQLGKRIGVSAVKMNKLLQEANLQDRIGYTNSKNKQDYYWEATVEALDKKFCAYLDVGKGNNSSGAPIRQLKWYPSVLKFLEKSDGTVVIDLTPSENDGEIANQDEKVA